MSYAFAAIIEQEDVDETWAPRIVDKAGSVAWNDRDGEVKSLRATALTVYRGGVGDKHKVLSVDDVSFQLHLSDARLVAVCRKYDKGGGWVGGFTAMVVFNAVSKARAAIRSHGSFLVGQLRWPWMTAVGYTEKHSWLTDNQLRLVALDESGVRIYADFKLPKDVDARAVAGHILARAAAARGLADVPALPAYDRRTKLFALASLAGAVTAAPVVVVAERGDDGPPPTSPARRAAQVVPERATPARARRAAAAART